MLVIALAGMLQYRKLGREEDPPFTIKTMVVKTLWPGATTRRHVKQVTDRIEKKLEEVPNLDYLKSYTKPGESVVFVNLKDSTPRVARSRTLVSGAQEGRRHQADVAAGRAGAVLQRRVRRHLLAHFRASPRTVSATASCATMPSACAPNCSACRTSPRSTSSARRTRKSIWSSRPSSSPPWGSTSPSSIADAAGAERHPAQRRRSTGRREDRDPRLRPVHLGREPRRRSTSAPTAGSFG